MNNVTIMQHVMLAGAVFKEAKPDKFSDHCFGFSTKKSLKTILKKPQTIFTLCISSVEYLSY